MKIDISDCIKCNVMPHMLIVANKRIAFGCPCCHAHAMWTECEGIAPKAEEIKDAANTWEAFNKEDGLCPVCKDPRSVSDLAVFGNHYCVNGLRILPDHINVITSRAQTPQGERR